MCSCQVTEAPSLAAVPRAQTYKAQTLFGTSLLLCSAQCFCSLPLSSQPLFLFRKAKQLKASDGCRQGLSPGGVTVHFTKQTAALARAPFGCHDKADSLCLGGTLCPHSGCPGFRGPALSPRLLDRSAACRRHLTSTVLQFEAALSCSAKKNLLGFTAKGIDQAVPLLQTLRPLVSLKAKVLPMTTRSCVIWTQFPHWPRDPQLSLALCV